jgi:hypothetical protein
MAIVPQHNMEDNLVITRVKMMPVSCPARSIAMYLNVSPAALTAGKGNDGVLKVGPSLQVPASWRMDSDLLAIQGVQSRRTPAWVKPQTAYELFRNSTVPGHCRFRQPGVGALKGV